MASESHHRGDTKDGPSLDVALEILSNGYRRRLLVALLEHNPQADDDTQTSPDAMFDEADLDRLMIRMNHVHLPKLEEAGFIEWDRQEGAISKGPRFEEIKPLLVLMDEHADELPPGWL